MNKRCDWVSELETVIQERKEDENSSHNCPPINFTQRLEEIIASNFDKKTYLEHIIILLKNQLEKYIVDRNEELVVLSASYEQQIISSEKYIKRKTELDIRIQNLEFEIASYEAELKAMSE